MPKTGMNLLTDLGCKNAKVEKSPHRDGGGLYLIVEPVGEKCRKWWKLRTVFVKKESSFSLGDYPEVKLAEAREKRDAIRRKIAAGIDPAVSRKEEKARAGGAGSFEAVARDWYTRFKKEWSLLHAEKKMGWLEKDIFPYIGPRQIEEITPPEVLAVLRRVEERSLEIAHRAKVLCGQVFRHEMQTSGKVKYNPVDALRGALPTVKPKHMAAPTDPKTAAPLLRMIYGYEGSFLVTRALRLAPLVFVRPGELRQAEWSGIDLDQAEWRHMVTKTKTEHLVPLSRQAVAILREVHELTGSGHYVFPSSRSASRPMSNNTVNAALRRMGIDTQNELTGHGFRAMAMAIMEEVLDIRPELLEHQLAHAVKDPLGRAYNRTKHLDKRRTMMQEWADYLDKLKAGADIIPFRQAAR